MLAITIFAEIMGEWLPVTDSTPLIGKTNEYSDEIILLCNARSLWFKLSTK